MRIASIVHATTRDGGVITGRYLGQRNETIAIVVTVDGTEWAVHCQNMVTPTPDEMEAHHNIEDLHHQTHNLIYGDRFAGKNLSEIDYGFTE